MSRLEQWQEERTFKPVVLEPDSNKELEEMRARAPERDGVVHDVPWAIIGTSKELVFVLEGGDPKFVAVNFSLDARYLDLVLGPTIEISGFDGDDEVKEILAMALSEDVPVYPNDDAAAVALARLHSELLQDGFKVNIDGEQIWLTYTGARPFDLGSNDPLESYTATASITPADLLAIRSQGLYRQRNLERAHRTIAVLEGAIEELQTELDATSRNEHALQRILTAYPPLFGIDYSRIIPKHRLGGEYEMDYALERHSGLVDLVEIEASTHSLYTKSGNPTSALVHAEQQVLDWLDWIDSNGPYARSQLKGLWRPVAYIVIGRSGSLSEEDENKLRRRNVSWSGNIEVITYDDLLSRAKGILRVLTSGQEY